LEEGVKFNLSRLKTFFLSDISLLWFVLLAIIMSTFWITVAFGVSIEDVQGFLFPLVLVVCWRLPKRASWRLPFPLVVLTLVLWIALHLSGLAIAKSSGNNVFLSRLEGDQIGLSARELYQRYSEIATTYGLPPMSLVQLRFEDDTQARKRLLESPRSPFVITGSRDWLRAVFPLDAPFYLSHYASVLGPQQMASAVPEEVRAFAASLSPGVVFLKLPLVGVPLVVLFQPEAVNVPGGFTELNLHALGWLAKGLERPEENGDSNGPGSRSAEDSKRAVRYEALLEAVDILDDWKTGGLLGVCRYLIATQDLLTAIDDQDTRPERFDSIIMRLGEAGAVSSKKSDPEVFAALLNNAAVTRAVQSGAAGEDLSKAKKWLWKAMRVRDAHGQPVLGAKAAFLNFFLLDYYSST
jgi:hypothetical protein